MRREAPVGNCPGVKSKYHSGLQSTRKTDLLLAKPAEDHLHKTYSWPNQSYRKTIC